MTESDQGDERREGYEEEELPPDPPGNPRPPAADTVTLESILAIVQDFHTEIRMRLDEHEAQLHHLNANYVRTTSPPDLVPNRPHSPQRRQQPLPLQDARRDTRFIQASSGEDIYGRLPPNDRNSPSLLPPFEQTRQSRRNNQRGYEDPDRQQQQPQQQQPQRPLYTNPGLHRQGTAPPGSLSETHSPAFLPRETPPLCDPAEAKTMMPAGRTNIKAPIFGGTDLERVTNWIWKMETYL